MTQQGPIPVIDLFAGPGGLGEGFTSLVDGNGQRRFAIKVAIEKDPVAHRTLSLRAFFRQFKPGAVPDCYYDYVRGKITREELFAHRAPSPASLSAIARPMPRPDPVTRATFPSSLLFMEPYRKSYRLPGPHGRGVDGSQRRELAHDARGS